MKLKGILSFSISFQWLARVLRVCAKLLGFVSLFCVGSAYATSTALSLSDIETTVGDSVLTIATIMTDVSLISGVGFIMASFFKFHQHKLNPTQVPMSQGLTLLLIGAGLCVFPSLIPTASNSVFGTSNASMAQVHGSGIASLLTGGS